MKHPSIIRLTPEWQQGLAAAMTLVEKRGWVPARPLGFSSIQYRIKATWLVWTGRADALVWPGGQ